MCVDLKAWDKRAGQDETKARTAVRAMSLLLLTVACIPILLALSEQVANWVDIPIWDEWDTPGVAILHAADHKLTWSDLFAQHNESRKVVPRLVCLALAQIGHWDIRHAMILTSVSLCLTSVIILLFLRKQFGTHRNVETLIAWAAINALLFIPSQYENLLSGFVFELFIPILCLLACSVISRSRWRLPAKVALNSILSLIATFTFAHGMLLWPLVVPIPNEDERSKPRWVLRAAPWYLLYAGLAIISIAYYFAGYKRPDVSPSPAQPAQILQVLDFFVFWIGAPFRSPWITARVAGYTAAGMTLVTTAATFCVLRQNRALWRQYYPWILLGAFGLGSGILTAIGRVNLGVDLVFNTSFDGFSSIKYNATSVFVSVACVAILLNLHRDLFAGQPRRMRSYSFVLVPLLCLLLGFAWLGTWIEERSRLPLFRKNRERARTAVIWSKVLPDNPDIFAAYPYPVGFSHRVEDLRRLHLLRVPEVGSAMMAKISTVPESTTEDGGRVEGGETWGEGKIRLKGSARNPVRNRRAEYVLFGWSQSGESFHPFAAVALSGSTQHTNFDQILDTSGLPREATKIRGWSIDLTTQEAFPMAGSFVFIGY